MWTTHGFYASICHAYHPYSTGAFWFFLFSTSKLWELGTVVSGYCISTLWVLHLDFLGYCSYSCNRITVLQFLYSSFQFRRYGIPRSAQTSAQFPSLLPSHDCAALRFPRRFVLALNCCHFFDFNFNLWLYSDTFSSSNNWKEHLLEHFIVDLEKSLVILKTKKKHRKIVVSGAEQMAAGRCFMVLNFTAHSAMYSYFAVMALGYRVPKVSFLFCFAGI